MSYNSNNTTVRRLMSEWRKLQKDPDPMFVAGPVSDEDLFTWHFTIKGPPDSAFEGGIYHGKIVFPQEYPLKPPDIYFLTPNGRFDVNKKLCLNFTSYHPESWNPGWDVRTVLTAVSAFMPTKAEGAVGGLDTSDPDRRILAHQSHDWHCKECELTITPDPFPEDKQKDEGEKSDKAEEENEEQFDNKEEEADKPPSEGTEENHINEPEIIVENEDNVDMENKENNASSSDSEEEEINNEKHQEEEGKVHLEEEEKKEEIANNDNEQKENEDIDNNAEANQNEEGVQQNGNLFDYNSLKNAALDRQKKFYPLYDVPIIILFIFLLYLTISF